jgi:hypothetical protein
MGGDDDEDEDEGSTDHPGHKTSNDEDDDK